MVFYIIEIVLILVLIGLQIALFLQTKGDVSEYKHVFEKAPFLVSKFVRNAPESNSEEVKDELDENDVATEFSMLTLLSSGSQNPIQTTILKSINTYLLRNRGASIDFHIIKEIVSRNVESKEDSIQTKMPSPLYLGLAATMLGIILGLFSMGTSSGTGVSGQSLNIQPLINSVMLAMVASVLGLILTTVLSIWIFKPAKDYSDGLKESFLTLIQTDLLPVIMGPGQSGMAQLASKLDDFGRNTGATVKTFSTIVERTGLQLSSSNELLKKVENLDLAKVSGANLKVLRSLESMMDTFNAFPAYYNELNGSLNATTSLIKELSALNERSRSFTEVLENLTQGVKASKDANEFFSRNIQSFADYSDVVNRAVESTSRSMNQAIALLEESALNAFERINQSVEIHDQNLRHSFQLAIDHYNTVAKTQVEIIRNLQSTYLEVFKPLQEIPKLLNSVEGLGKDTQNNHIELLELLKKHLGELGSLKRIDGNFNSNVDYDRLEEIFSRALSRSKPNEGTFDIVLKISLLCASVSLFLYLVFLSLQ